MKKTYVFATTIILICSILLSGCLSGNNITENTTDSQNQNDIVTGSDNSGSISEESNQALISDEESSDFQGGNITFGKTGWALDVDDTAYYWRFTGDDFQDYGMFYGMVPQVENSAVSLVSFCDGTETVLAEAETAGQIVVTDENIYYNDNNSIIRINRDGSDCKTVAEGYICAVSENGKYLFYYLQDRYYNHDLYSLSLETNKSVLLSENSTLAGVHNETAFYMPDYIYSEDETEKSFSLCSVNGDGSEKITLYKSDADSVIAFPEIAHIRFTDENVYFSYGSVAGSAAVYQGGDIVRVKYDGTNAEILAENTIEPMFEINPDGSISNYFIWEINEAYFTFRETHYKDENGNLVWFDSVTGKPTVICPCFSDDEFDLSVPDENLVNVTGKYAFFIMHHGYYDHKNSLGWRDAYTREKSLFYMVDRASGEIVTSYEF